MAKIITSINEKGGIGKTTVCFNVAWELSNTKKVLLVDMDGQRANLTYFCGIKKPEDLMTMADVLKKGRSAKEAVKNIKKNLDIIPGSIDVADISHTVKAKRMREALREISNEYDYIFIDVNPSPDWRHVISLAASDYALIVMLPDMTSLESDNGIVESVEEIKATLNPDLKVLGILFNRNEERSNMGKQVKAMAEKFAKRLETKVFQSRIRNAVTLGEVPAVHKGITEYDSRSAVAEDVRALAKELIKECK